jgi:DNA-directed RNA polymerase specialized sigma24 family protein
LNDVRWETEPFQRHRRHLQAVAYRMLGSVNEAEDALQEAWLRLSRSQQETIHNTRAWLTTIVGRVCIDMLRARQSRREDHVGGWVPEPIVEVDERADPEQQTLNDRCRRASAAGGARGADPDRAGGLRAARHVRAPVR